jgi:hypothetical protein
MAFCDPGCVGWHALHLASLVFRRQPALDEPLDGCPWQPGRYQTPPRKTRASFILRLRWLAERLYRRALHPTQEDALRGYPSEEGRGYAALTSAREAAQAWRRRPPSTSRSSVPRRASPPSSASAGSSRSSTLSSDSQFYELWRHPVLRGVANGARPGRADRQESERAPRGRGPLGADVMVSP